MQGSRVRPLGPGEGHRLQKRARYTTTTEVVSRDLRWGIIAAIHLVFVFIHRRFTGGRLRPCGGLAITITHLVNTVVGVPDMGGIGGVPGITGTEDAPEEYTRLLIVRDDGGQKLASARTQLRRGPRRLKTSL